jgi:beta-lactamase regulating signal transducer with metallopeptidase domain
MTATQWGEVLTSFSLQVLVLMAIGILLERIAVRPIERCAVWSGCFLSTIVLACTAVTFPRFHLFEPWSMLEPGHHVSAIEVQSDVGRLLLWIWCVGALIVVGRWIVRGVVLQRFLRRCERLTMEQACELLTLGGSEMKTAEEPAVLVSAEADGPFCWQLHRPVIVLPRFLLEGCREDLRHVMIHELEHLATKHPLQLFIQHLAQALCWFHPVVWNASWRASLAREFVCDDAAAAQGANCAAYLRTLLHIAERCEQKNKTLAIGFSKTTNELIVRANRLVRLAQAAPATKLTPSGVRWVNGLLIVVTIAMMFVWIPFDPLNSSRSHWSPWPSWTAKSMHCFDMCLRDYEVFDRQVQLHELTTSGKKRETAFRQDLTGE